MATFEKKEKEKRRRKKKQDKAEKKRERQANSPGGGLDNMIAYVDAMGNIVDTPPDPTEEKEEINAEDIQIGIAKAEIDENAGHYTGTIDFFNHDKGFGFIKESGGRDSYFVHHSNMDSHFSEGDKVAFELEKGERGMNAVRVTKAA